MMEHLFIWAAWFFIGIFVGAFAFTTSVPVEDMDKANTRCERNGGLKEIRVDPDGKLQRAMCQDGATFSAEQEASK